MKIDFFEDETKKPKIFQVYQKIKEEAGISEKLTPENFPKIKEAILRISLSQSVSQLAQVYNTNTSCVSQLFTFLGEPTLREKAILFELFETKVTPEQPINIISIGKKLGFSAKRYFFIGRILEDMGVVMLKEKGYSKK